MTGSTPRQRHEPEHRPGAPTATSPTRSGHATRFTLANLGKLAGQGDQLSVISDQSSEGTDYRSLHTDHWTLADRWIESRLNHTVAEVTRLFDSYQYGEAGRQAYEFLWARWPTGTSRPPRASLTLAAGRPGGQPHRLVRVLDQTLRLLHPFIPFVTEDIWQQLRAAALATSVPAGDGDWPEALIVAPWPVAGKRNKRTEATSERIQEIVRDPQCTR